MFQGIKRPIGTEIFRQSSVAPVAVNPEERQRGASRLYRYQRRPGLGASFVPEYCGQLPRSSVTGRGQPPAESFRISSRSGQSVGWRAASVRPDRRNCRGCRLASRRAPGTRSRPPGARSPCEAPSMWLRSAVCVSASAGSADRSILPLARRGSDFTIWNAAGIMYSGRVFFRCSRSSAGECTASPETYATSRVWPDSVGLATTTASSIVGSLRSVVSISPGSIRNPRTLIC